MKIKDRVRRGVDRAATRVILTRPEEIERADRALHAARELHKALCIITTEGTGEDQTTEVTFMAPIDDVERWLRHAICAMTTCPDGREP